MSAAMSPTAAATPAPVTPAAAVAAATTTPSPAAVPLPQAQGVVEVPEVTEVARDTVSVAEFASEHLTHLGYEAFADQLTAAWSNIGESAETQKAYIAELSSNIRALLDNAVAASSQRKTDIESLVARKTDNVANLKVDLAAAVDVADASFAVPGPEVSLIQQLHEIENVEIKLITERQAWVDRVEAKRDRAAAICHELGMPLDAKFAEVGALSPDRIAAFDAHIAFLEQTQEERKQIIADSVASIKEYWKVLETTPATHLGKSIADEACDLGVHIEVIEALQQMKADLDVEYQAREAETAELGIEIQHLWDLLQIDPKFQQYFSEKNGGIGLSAVEACRDERQRLLIKKEKLLPRIIAHERAIIAKLFNQTSCDDDNQRKLFGAFHEPPEVQGEDYLNVLKGYTTRLETRFEGLQPIVTRIERRQVLVDERTQYEALISDPARLTSRSRGLNHLKENEMRIRVEKKLPKLEEVIGGMVTKWEQENECTLSFAGKPFMATMKAEQEAYAALKEERRLNRTEALKMKKQEENAPPAAWKRTKRRVGGRTQKLNATGGGVEN